MSIIINIFHIVTACRPTWYMIPLKIHTPLPPCTTSSGICLLMMLYVYLLKEVWRPLRTPGPAIPGSLVPRLVTLATLWFYSGFALVLCLSPMSPIRYEGVLVEERRRKRVCQVEHWNINLVLLFLFPFKALNTLTNNTNNSI